MSPTLTGLQYMDTFHRYLLRAIKSSLISVLVYIIDDSSRSGAEMKYPDLSAQARILLREKAPRCCQNYTSDRREACGLPKHRILYDQPSAVVWLVSRCHGPSEAGYRGLSLSSDRLVNGVDRSGPVAFVTDGGVWGVCGKVLAGANRGTEAENFPVLLQRNADCVASNPVLRSKRTATDQLCQLFVLQVV
jgi:hypothetical protein